MVKAGEIQYARGDDGQMHALPSDTQQRIWFDWKAGSEEKDRNRDRAGYARDRLEETLPLQLFLDFPDWFKPLRDGETGIDVNESLLEKNQQYFDKSPFFLPLVRKTFGFKNLSVEERRDNLNPWRANNAIKIKVAFFDTILDREEYLKARMSDPDSDEIISTSPNEYGLTAENWVGKEIYDHVAETALRVMDLVQKKKRIGQRHQIAKARLAKLDMLEDQSRIALLNELEVTGKHMLLPLETAKRLYALGNFALLFLGSNNDQIAKSNDWKLRERYVSDILGSFRASQLLGRPLG